MSHQTYSSPFWPVSPGIFLNLPGKPCSPRHMPPCMTFCCNMVTWSCLFFMCLLGPWTRTGHAHLHVNSPICHSLWMFSLAGKVTRHHSVVTKSKTCSYLDDRDKPYHFIFSGLVNVVLIKSTGSLGFQRHLCQYHKLAQWIVSLRIVFIKGAMAEPDYMGRKARVWIHVLT